MVPAKEAGDCEVVEPYYDRDGVTIYMGDCRDVLPQLDVNGFVWTDPPYNVGKDYGVLKDDLTNTEYLAFLKKWVTTAKDKSRKMAVYTPQKWMLDYWKELGDDYRQIVLSYGPEGAIRYGFVNQFSSILTNAKPIGYIKNVWHNCQMPGLGWFFREDSFGHPGYTSEDITMRVLMGFAAADEIIIDPFMGSGTTIRCAKTLNRKVMGIELNREYCDIAISRLSQQAMVLE